MRLNLAEQIEIEVQAAGYGSRALAYMMDFALRWGTVTMFALIALYVLYLSVGSLLGPIEFVESIGSSVSNGHPLYTLLAIGVIILFVVEWFYPVYFEVFRHGVTPGKRLFGLRVVDENGLPLTFQQSALRTILLIVDFMPVFGAVGLISISMTRRSQRLGDVLARTMVIYDINEEARTLSFREQKEVEFILPLKCYALLETYLRRKEELFPEIRKKLALEVAKEVQPFAPDVLTALDDSGLLETTLVAIYQNARPERETFETSAA